ncbi:MAG: hypothetical protein GX028_01730 [Clostridiaceae bacterium]|nr:hypothetical protein [Clostridiaceae bacterium]
MIYLLAISTGLLAFAVMSIVIRIIMRDRITILARINNQIGQLQNDQPVKIRKKKKSRDPVSLAIANELSNAGIKVKDDIRVITATGRSSGVIIGSIPLIIGGILALINPDYMMTFFNTRSGNIMLMVAGGMEILGYLLIRKIVDIKY